MNSKCKEGITYDQWHVSDLTEVIDLSEDYFAWLANEVGVAYVVMHVLLWSRYRSIVRFNYPFLLNTMLLLLLVVVVVVVVVVVEWETRYCMV